MFGHFLVVVVYVISFVVSCFICFFFFFKQKTAYEMRISDWRFRRVLFRSLPRVRDFRGISGRAFDGRGNYNIGVKEQIIFPEIEYDKIDAVRGMNISITTTAKTDDEAKALLTAFSFPFRN